MADPWTLSWGASAGAAPKPWEMEYQTPSPPEPTPAPAGMLSVAGRGAVQGAIGGTGEALKGVAQLGDTTDLLSPYYNTYTDMLHQSPAEQRQTLTKVRQETQDLPDHGGAVLDAITAALQQTKPGQPVSYEQFVGKSVPDTGLYKAGEAVDQFGQKIAPMTAEEKASLPGQVGRGVGGLAPIVAAGVLGGPGAALPLGMGIMGVQGAGEAGDAARAAGATPDQTQALVEKNTALNTVIGGMDLGALLAPVERSAPGATAWAMAKLQQAARSGVVFTGLGEAQTYLADQAQKDVAPNAPDYSPDAKRIASELITGGLLGVLAPAQLRAKGVEPAVNPVAKAEGVGDFNDSSMLDKAAADSVMSTTSVDDAITAATAASKAGAVDVGGIISRAQQPTPSELQVAQQPKLTSFFSRLGGTIEQGDDGTATYTDQAGKSYPLQVWDESQATAGDGSTISPELAAAQRAHYQSLGVDVVYFQHKPGIIFDGAVSPFHPDTIFLSNDPSRNAAQVGAHEFTHILESTTLPDGSNLGDLLHQQVLAGLTDAGRKYAMENFGKGGIGPTRDLFEPGPAGDQAHADAVTNHIITELGADIGGEAPRFGSFVDKVADEVTTRFGAQAGQTVYQRILTGIKNALATMRSFFGDSRLPEGWGGNEAPNTVSQNWVTNLEDIHQTLAQGYAQRYGTQFEREQARIAGMKDEADRSWFAANPEIDEMNPVPPDWLGNTAGPVDEMGFDNRPPLDPQLVQRAVTLRRWLAQFDQGKQDTVTGSPRGQFLQHQIDAITAPVGGDETQLGDADAKRLANARLQLTQLRNSDTPDMAKVRRALDVVTAKMYPEAGPQPAATTPTEATASKPEPTAVTSSGAAPTNRIYDRPVSPGFDEVGPREPATPSAVKPIPRAPASLVGFLKAKGGLLDDTFSKRVNSKRGRADATARPSDLQAMDARSVPGLVKAKTGMPLDQAARAAGEAGYFPELGGELPTINHLLDAVREEVAGRKRYSDRDQAALEAHQDALAQNEHVDRLGQEFGLDPTKMAANRFWSEISEHMSVEESKRQQDDMAAGVEHDFAEAERRSKAYVEGRGEAWEPDDVYQGSTPRTLRDLENEHQQEAATRTASEGESGPGASEPPGGRAGSVQERAGQGGGGAGAGRRGEGEDSRQAVIPGAERATQEQVDTNRVSEEQRLQLLRGQQSMLRGENHTLSDQEGGLFSHEEDQRQSQIKFSPRDESGTDRPVWFSGLLRAVEGSKTEKATPGQWLGTIRNMPGVKGDELRWTGVEDWLNGQTRSVTKEEVADYVREHQVTVTEVMHGEQRPVEAMPKYSVQETEHQWEAVDENGIKIGAVGKGTVGGRQEAEEYLSRYLTNRFQERARAAASGNDTKFGKYALPGGENYRELLLTLPAKDNITRESNGNPAGWGDIVERGNTGADFRSSHWDEPNILAHVRFDDRWDGNEKTLHVAEVQSDWMQAGRRKGFFNPEKPWQVFDPKDGKAMAEFATKDEARTMAERAGGAHLDYSDARTDQVPDAPFKTAWPELGMKRILRYAAEHNYDRVTWDTGATNADRYHLSKHVDRVTYAPETQHLRAFKNGDTVLRDTVPPEKLPDVIGKDAADKLLQSEIKPDSAFRGAQSENVHSISGLDLKVGGSGMAAFYDRMLPDTVNKMVKKWGGKVEPGDVRTKGEERVPAHAVEITPEMRASVMQGQPLFSPRITGESDRTYSPEQLAAFRRTGREVDEPGIMQRVQSLRQNLRGRIVQWTVDQFDPIKKVSPMAYVYARLSKGTAGAFEGLLTLGKLRLVEGVYQGGERGGFIQTVATPLKGEIHDFLWWVAGHRADRLATEDRENLFQPEDIAAMKSLAQGQTKFDYTLSNGTVTRNRALIYADTLAKYDAFNRNVLDIAEQSGLIDPKQRAAWEHEMYVPFYRVADKDGSFIGPRMGDKLVKQSAFKALNGGSEKLNSDLLDNVLMNWHHLIDAAAKNRAGLATMKDAIRGPDAPASEVTRIVGSDGKVIYTTKGANPTIIKGGDKADVVWVMQQGKQRFFHLDDPMLFTAISSLATPTNLPRLLTVFKGLETLGVTASPFFKIRTLIRDSLQAVATGEMSYNPIKNVAQGAKSTNLAGALGNFGRAVVGAAPKELHFNDAYFDALVSGGLIRFGSMLDGSASRRVEQLVREGTNRATFLDDPDKLNALWSKAKTILSTYNELGNQAEEINRQALYEQMIKKGAGPAEAAYAARDLEDYSMMGSLPAIRMVIQMVPFMNARGQGLYKVYRSMKGNPRRAATVLGALAAFSIGNYLMNADDEDYKKLPDSDRDNFWWFKVAGTVYRVPTPFEYGAMAALARDGFELFFNPEMTGQRFYKDVKSLFLDNLSMNPIPQAVKPLIDVWSNTNSFSGAPIETEGMKDLRSEARYTINTSMPARWVSEAANTVARAIGGPNAEFLSPVQLDYVINGYTGWLGSFATTIADRLSRPLTNEPVRPTMDMWRAATGGMISTMPESQSRYVNQMYEQADAVDKAYATYLNLIKQGKVQEAQGFVQDNAEQIRHHGVFQGGTQVESSLQAQARFVETNPNLSSVEKRKQLDMIHAAQNRNAQQVEGVQ